MSFAVRPPRTVPMRAADGARLDADVWAPDAPGRFPVLLMRQPYGRRIASTVVYAHPAWYAAQGFIVAVQDVRGSGSSEGAFRLFADEAADGALAVGWARDLPASNGRVGMYGFSYQGNTQLLALAGGGGPDVLAPCMAGWDVRTDWAWENGAWPLAANLGWGLQMGFLRATHLGDAAAAGAFRAAHRAMPLQSGTRPAVLREHGAHSHYGDWLAHPEAGPPWDAIAPAMRLGGVVPPPTLHIGGWGDQMLPGTLAGHAALAGRLLIGPWAHLPWGRRVGAVDLGPDAASPVDAVQAAFFRAHLQDGADDALPALRLFDVGARAWRDFAAWPATGERMLQLGGTGRAAATASDGTLREAAGAPGAEWFVHDPWRPVPSLGGPHAQPSGMHDRAALDDRADVACFTGAPLAAPWTICGAPVATLHVEADQPSFDLSLVLSVVAPDGRATTLAHGHHRIDQPHAQPLTLALRPTFCTVPAGDALRLSVAGAAFPAFAVNPGTGAAAHDFVPAEERSIAIAIRHGGSTPSRLGVPVVC